MSETKKRLAEAVSALVDGEASAMELHRILKDVDAEQHGECTSLTDHGSRGKWSRYNLISNSIAEAPMGFADISCAVSKAIDAEETYSSSRTVPNSSGLSSFGISSSGISSFGFNSFDFSSFGRFTIAASVAMVAILGVQQLNTVDPVHSRSLQVVEMGIEAGEQARGPAIQFPADFQPMVQARTVNAGGNIKTSQRPVTLVKIANPDRDLVKDREVRAFLSEILEIHSFNESDNGIQGMLPLARHLDAGEETDTE